MDLCADGKQYYVGIMEYQEDGVVYDFIDNDEFFSWGNPYTNLIDDIPKLWIVRKEPARPTFVSLKIVLKKRGTKAACQSWQCTISGVQFK